MSDAKTEAIAQADAYLNNVALANYTELLDVLQACLEAVTISEHRAANRRARDLLRAAGRLGGPQ